LVAVRPVSVSTTRALPARTNSQMPSGSADHEQAAQHADDAQRGPRAFVQR
jgi:hypothetical protein